MTRRLGESLFLLNNRRITSEEHASEVAQVLDRIVNSESHGAVSKILALDTLRDAGLIGDAQLAAQKSIVLARRAASAAMRGASAGAPEMDGETDGETDPWAFMAPEDGQRLATRVDRARAETEAQRARIAEMYRRERADARDGARLGARTGVRTPGSPERPKPPSSDEGAAGDYESDVRDRLASAAESAARAAAAAADIETFAREMESKHRVAGGIAGIGDAAPGEGDAGGMSLGFGPWDDAFRYDVAFAYRPNARTESSPGNGDGDGARREGSGTGDGARREGSGTGDERSGLFEFDRALARARRPWVREGGADAEEEGEANRRVDSPKGSKGRTSKGSKGSKGRTSKGSKGPPSADSDVERVDEDAATTTPAEDTQEDEDVGQSQSQQKSSADSDVERVDEDAATTTPAEDTKEDEDVGQSQSRQKSTKGQSRAAALLRAASAKEMKTKPRRAGFFARMFGVGGKKEGVKAEGAAVASGSEETDGREPEPPRRMTFFEATATFVGAPPKVSLRLAFVLERRVDGAVRIIEATLPAGAVVTRGETIHRLVAGGAAGGTTRYDATRVIVALRGPASSKAKPASAHVDSVSLTAFVMGEAASGASVKPALDAAQKTRLATFAVNAKVRRGKGADPGLEEVRVAAEATREESAEEWAERRTKPKSEDELPRRYWYSKSRKTSTFKEPAKYHPVETEGTWARVNSVA